MASSLLQVRIDEDLKRQSTEIFNNLGLDMSSAVRLFLKRVVIAQGLPFSMNLESNDHDFDPVEYLNQIEIVRPEASSSFDPVEYLDSLN